MSHNGWGTSAARTRLFTERAQASEDYAAALRQCALYAESMGARCARLKILSQELEDAEEPSGALRLVWDRARDVTTPDA